MRPPDFPHAEHRRTLTIAFGLSMAPFVGLALGRFGYALLLPDMRADLDWTYGAAGALGSVNAVGYLVGALTTTVAVRVIGTRRLIVLSVVVSALSFALSALAGSWSTLALLRFAAGVTGGWCYIVGAQVAGALPAGIRRRDALFGVYFGGMGLGILASGAALPVVVASGGWRWGWWALTALGAVAAAALTVALRHLGAPSPTQEPDWPTYGLRVLAPLLVSYFLFGLGYIAYMTFAFAYLAALDASTGAAAAQWMTLGAAAFVASFLWPRLLSRMRGGRALAAILTVQAGATAVLAAGDALPVILLSSALFGLTLSSVAGAVAAIARAVVPAAALLRALSALTVVFAVGQVAGPGLTGAISDRVGLRAGLLTSAAVLLLGAAFATRQTDDPGARAFPRLLRPSGVPDVKARQLLATPMFATLTPRQVRWLAGVADQMYFPAGTRIDTIGSYTAWIYVVLDGEVSCVPEIGANRPRPRHLLLTISEARVLILDRRWLGAVDRMIPGLAAQVSVHGTVGADLAPADQAGRSVS